MEFSENLQKADININVSGDNEIIPAPAQGYIVIDHINLVPNGAVTLQLKDGATNYGGAYGLTTSQGFVIENSMRNEKGVITISPQTAFKINLGSSVQVSGFVRYRIIGQ